jgi:predicted lysophospholipase L1 biosynthesis ABC-type transport system permease subunit
MWEVVKVIGIAIGAVLGLLAVIVAVWAVREFRQASRGTNASKASDE